MKLFAALLSGVESCPASWFGNGVTICTNLFWREHEHGFTTPPFLTSLFINFCLSCDRCVVWHLSHSYRLNSPQCLSLRRLPITPKYLGSPHWYCKNRVGWFRAFLILLTRVLLSCACARLRVYTCAWIPCFFNDAFNYEDIIRTLVPKVCSTDPLGTTTGSEGIRGYISVMDALKFTYLLIKGIMHS
jgi:hypothetical protein